ncbi:hypothetical protein [Pseudodesulfovibrio sp.]|uniref:hypothetical protein n=1 Tax=unclassified Pseudodesulfovibrio TaxID=2661612 RepID=UPI003B009B92
MAFVIMIGAMAARIGVFSGSGSETALSDVVAVKGTVKVDDLRLTGGEVRKLNRAVEEHRGMFPEVDLFLDVKDKSHNMEPDTVLVWAMILKANGECEVRSWSRKVSRTDLVPQMILYMDRAAKEYQEFMKHPDVKQSFKCLYI